MAAPAPKATNTLGVLCVHGTSRYPSTRTSLRPLGGERISCRSSCSNQPSRPTPSRSSTTPSTLCSESCPRIFHGEFQKEAEAIASTIFNRQQSILETRNAYAVAKKAEDDATNNRTAAIKAHGEFTKSPSVTKKKLIASGIKADQVNAEFARQSKALQDSYDNATKALNRAQTARIKAVSDKKAAEAYVDVGARSRSTITLTDIVTAPGPNGTSQYEGYAPGKKKYSQYNTFTKEAQQRNEVRWSIARMVLMQLALDPRQRHRYIEFRSNKGGKRTLKQNETRIGGNDFW